MLFITSLVLLGPEAYLDTSLFSTNSVLLLAVGSGDVVPQLRILLTKNLNLSLIINYYRSSKIFTTSGTVAMASNSIQLPNPLTPLAWLSPEIASQVEVAKYLFSAMIGVNVISRYIFRTSISFSLKGLVVGRAYVYSWRSPDHEEP